MNEAALEQRMGRCRMLMVLEQLVQAMGCTLAEQDRRIDGDLLTLSGVLTTPTGRCLYVHGGESLEDAQVTLHTSAGLLVQITRLSRFLASELLDLTPWQALAVLWPLRGTALLFQDRQDECLLPVQADLSLESIPDAADEVPATQARLPSGALTLVGAAPDGSGTWGVRLLPMYLLSVARSHGWHQPYPAPVDGWQIGLPPHPGAFWLLRHDQAPVLVGVRVAFGRLIADGIELDEVTHHQFVRVPALPR